MAAPVVGAVGSARRQAEAVAQGISIASAVQTAALKDAIEAARSAAENREPVKLKKTDLISGASAILDTAHTFADMAASEARSQLVQAAKSAGSSITSARAAGVAGKRAALSGVQYAAVKAHQGVHGALGVARGSVSVAKAGTQAVWGNMYDLADGLLMKPLVEAPGNFTPGVSTGNGYCFPLWQSPEFDVPRITCPEGYQLKPLIGKCMKRAYRRVDVCFQGPVCVAPYNRTGETSCFPDKVMQVVTGVLAMQKAGIKLPVSLAPSLVKFGLQTANVPFSLLKESFELNLGAVAAAVGVSRGFLGSKDQQEWVALGTRLMAVDWTAIPDFNKLYESVMRAVQTVPSGIMDDVRKVAPSCVQTCCKPDVTLDTTYSTPRVACPAGRKMDMIGLKCVGSTPLGFAPCPSGMKTCMMSGWHRPLCAAQAHLFGIDGCTLFETLAFAHKLPKVACPSAA